MSGRKALVAIANLGLGALLGLVILKITAVYFGPEDLGDVEFATSILGMLYLLTDLNMSDAHVKRVSQGEHEGDCFATFAAFKIVSTALFVLLSAGILWLYVGVLGKPLVSTSLDVMVVTIVYYVARSVCIVPQSTFEAKQQIAKTQAGSLVETFVRFLLTALFALVLAALASHAGPLVGRVSPDNALWRWVAAHPSGALALTFTLSAVANAVVSLWLLRRALEKGRFRWDLLQSYFRFAIPLFSVAAFSIVSVNIDRIALGFFGSNVDTADFGALRRVVMVIDGIGAAVGLLLLPRLSSLTAEQAHGEAHQTMDRSLRYLSMLIVPMTAFLAVFPVPIITLVLANAWTDSAYVLSVLAFWVLVTTLARPYIYFVMGADRPGAVARIGIVTSLLNIALILVLVPTDVKSLGIRLFGLRAMGAAIGTLISGVVYLVMIQRETRQALGYHPPAHTWWHLAAAAVMSGALLALDAFTPLHLARWWSFPLYAVLGAAVYFAALFAMREFTADDYRWIRDAVHPGEMLRYLRAELRDEE